MTKNYAEMTMSELVVEYNKRSGKEPISKFRDKATALKRLARPQRQERQAGGRCEARKGPSLTS